MPLPKSQARYTYQDYLTWDDGERWELIGGEPYNMSPAPGTGHQDIVGNFFLLLRTTLKQKPCRTFISPIDVVLSEHDVVQPDVIVVCDPNKITEKNIQGAPDLVIEVLSPSTSRKDRREKFGLYERSGVREYIVVDPAGLYVERFRRGKDERFERGEILDHGETLILHSLPGVEIPLREIFETENPTETEKN